MTNRIDIEKRLVEILSNVVGTGPKSNHEPYSSNDMSKYVEKAIRNGDYAATGGYITQFEENLTELTGAKFVIATNTGTAALHVLLKCAGVSAGDEVLVPALSFVATANAITYLGATPHFLDVTFPYCSIDIEATDEYLTKILDFKDGEVVNKRTGCTVRAIIAVHVFGHANKLTDLKKLADRFNLPLIEDAAGALGTLYKKEHVGHYGIGGILSFNGNKTITTGGGGAILTNSEEIATKARHLATTAKISNEFVHDEIGFNYRMPNVNAALGCAQIEKITRLICGQRNLYFKYKTAFLDFQGVDILEEPSDCISNYWQQTLVLNPQLPIEKKKLIISANIGGIVLRQIWWPLPDLKTYKSAQTMDLVGAWQCHSNLINLPSSALLGLN